jgi:predicted MFS family arabinose efflux permease
VVMVGGVVLLPPLTGHVTGKRRTFGELFSLVREPDVQLSYLMTAVVMAAGFILIPNIASYLQFNLGVPEAHIKWAYLVGGMASFVATQGGGRLVDRLGSFRVGTFGTVLVMGVVFVFFFLPRESMSSGLVLVTFAGFMLAQGLRNVSYNTLTTKVPDAARRATFQSLQSAVQHGATSLAAFGSGLLLTEVARPPLSTDAPGRPARMLVGMERVSLVSMGLSLLIPVLLLVVERRVRAKQAAAQAACPTA